MTKEQFDAIIELLKFLGLIAGGVISIVKFFSYLETKCREKSVGATKIMELEKADRKVQDDIEDLQTADKGHEKDINKLSDDYTSLINRVWDFLGKK